MTKTTTPNVGTGDKKKKSFLKGLLKGAASATGLGKIGRLAGKLAGRNKSGVTGGNTAPQNRIDANPYSTNPKDYPTDRSKLTVSGDPLKRRPSGIRSAKRAEPKRSGRYDKGLVGDLKAKYPDKEKESYQKAKSQLDALRKSSLPKSMASTTPAKYTRLLKQFNQRADVKALQKIIYAYRSNKNQSSE